MLGPEANHYMLVSHAKNFLWRAGHMRDLIPLLGDGLLTIDGPDSPHAPQADAAGVPPRADRGRDRRDAGAEVDRALAELRPGEIVDIYDWTRRLALRVAMRALFGLDPDRAKAGGLNAAGEFEAALSFYGRDYLLQMLRGPRTPFAQMMRSRRRLDALLYEEIDRRRAIGRARRGHPLDAARRLRRGRRRRSAARRSATR